MRSRCLLRFDAAPADSLLVLLCEILCIGMFLWIWFIDWSRKTFTSSELGSDLLFTRISLELRCDFCIPVALIYAKFLLVMWLVGLEEVITLVVWPPLNCLSQFLLLFKLNVPSPSSLTWNGGIEKLLGRSSLGIDCMISLTSGNVSAC